MFVDGVENFLLARQRRLHAQPADAAHRRNGLEIQRVGHGDSHRRIVHCHWKETALPHETRGKVLDFGGHRRRLIERGQRHAELFGERRQDVAHRDEAEVDQNLAQLVAALFLEFKRAIQVTLLDLVPLDQHFAQPHGAARLIDKQRRGRRSAHR